MANKNPVRSARLLRAQREVLMNNGIEGLKQGRSGKAATWFRAALATNKALLEANPEDVDAQECACLLCVHLGYLARDDGDLAQARIHFEEALRGAEACQHAGSLGVLSPHLSAVAERSTIASAPSGPEDASALAQGSPKRTKPAG